jgi:16S rRNA (uracil1498-N3)-methyltransferase
VTGAQDGPAAEGPAGDGPQVVVATDLRDITVGTAVALAPDDVHHLGRVLRLADGAAVRLTDGAGHVAPARLAGRAAELVGSPVEVPRPAPRLALVQALTRSRRADDAVRTACELGVDLVVPLVAARTQGRPGTAEREALVARWRAIAAAALAQSRGAWAATVAPVTDVAGLAAAPPWDGPLLVAVPGAPSLPDRLAGLAGHAPAAATGAPLAVGVAVGPEGGWTPDEVTALTGAGWLPVGLGPTVLRSEHAGPAALAVLAAASGRWAAEG